MKILILSLFLGFFSMGCGHTIRFPSAHFATPIVADQQWGGSAHLALSTPTNVTVISDAFANPPDRTLLINDGNTAPLSLSQLGLDAHLAVYQATEVFIDTNMLGLRYQFLNHGAGANNWVASVHGALSQKRTTETGSSLGNRAKSEVTSSYAGISLGYKVENIIPYFSYIYEVHDVSTTVTNNSGNFGPYKDNGIHQYYALGVSSHGRGLSYGFEYNHLQIKWDRANKVAQDAFAFKVGMAW